MVVKKGSVTRAAKALHLTGQTVTGQIKLLEERLKGKLLEKQGRSVKATELGQLVYRYADKMFDLSYEMLDILHYQKQDSVGCEVGIADSLAKDVLSQILLKATATNANLHLQCYESNHKDLMSRLRDHKLDMILSDCAGQSLKYPDILSKKLGSSSTSFFILGPKQPLLQALSELPLFIPGRRTSVGQQLVVWLQEHNIKANIIGEFDDAALMQSFGLQGQGVFTAPTILKKRLAQLGCSYLGEVEDIQEHYHLIFAQRMIQHPAVKILLETDFNLLFSEGISI